HGPGAFAPTVVTWLAATEIPQPGAAQAAAGRQQRDRLQQVGLAAAVAAQQDHRPGIAAQLALGEVATAGDRQPLQPEGMPLGRALAWALGPAVVPLDCRIFHHAMLSLTLPRRESSRPASASARKARWCRPHRARSWARRNRPGGTRPLRPRSA